MDLLAEVTPQVMGQTGVAGMAIAKPLATGCINRFVDGIDNLGNLDTFHIAR
ncbi:hypothetical protein D3C81_2121380 [compost metagenome]